jgi:hypothetical protein
MGFEALLAVIDNYVSMRSQPVKKAATRMSDWDCGLAMEFEGSYADAGRKEQLEEATAALEKALNDYIEERVQAAIGGNSGSERRI